MHNIEIKFNEMRKNGQMKELKKNKCKQKPMNYIRITKN